MASSESKSPLIRATESASSLRESSRAETFNAQLSASWMVLEPKLVFKVQFRFLPIASALRVDPRRTRRVQHVLQFLLDGVRHPLSASGLPGGGASWLSGLDLDHFSLFHQFSEIAPSGGFREPRGEDLERHECRDAINSQA